MLKRLRNYLRRLLGRPAPSPCADCGGEGLRRPGQIIREVTDPTFLLHQLDALQQAGAAHPLGNQLSDRHYDTARTELQAAAAGSGPAAPFIARTPHASGLQSILSTCIESRAEALLRDAPHGLRRLCHDILADVAVFRRFGQCDPAYIETKLAQVLAMLEHRPDFPKSPAPPARLADDARIVMTGDWGTGLPGAVAVGQQMRAQVKQAAGRQCHVIHLGDVYYSGWREEYESRFLPYWPVQPGETDVLSWALNGNHDAYSGGHGYFGFLLRDPRFRGHRLDGPDGDASSSWFSLENDHWQILGLDSAYEDHALAGGQADWVAGRLAPGERRTMLLTHHQPLSAFEAVDTKLADRLRPAIDAHPLDAWFWGHEHRCTVYANQPAPYLRFGSCVGHGGVPRLLPDPTAAVTPPVTWAFDASETIEGNQWGLFGFAVLDFDGPAVRVRYFDENGRQAYETTI